MLQYSSMEVRARANTSVAWSGAFPARDAAQGVFIARHERQEGFLDHGSGRYKLIGLVGREDYYLYAGEWVEVWIGI